MYIHTYLAPYVRCTYTPLGPRMAKDQGCTCSVVLSSAPWKDEEVPCSWDFPTGNLAMSTPFLSPFSGSTVHGISQNDVALDQSECAVYDEQSQGGGAVHVICYVSYSTVQLNNVWHSAQLYRCWLLSYIPNWEISLEHRSNQANDKVGYNYVRNFERQLSYSHLDIDLGQAHVSRVMREPLIGGSKPLACLMRLPDICICLPSIMTLPTDPICVDGLEIDRL